MITTITLPYRKINLPPRGSFPARVVYTPIVETYLFFKNKKSPFSFHSVIDSGADFCVFPAVLGEMMGLDVEEGQYVTTFGVGGKDTIFFHNIKVGIIVHDEIWRFESYAGFSKKMNTRGVGLLGRDGFFDLFQEVSFNQNKRMLRLKGEGVRHREEGEEYWED